MVFIKNEFEGNQLEYIGLRWNHFGCTYRDKIRIVCLFFPIYHLLHATRVLFYNELECNRPPYFWLQLEIYDVKIQNKLFFTFKNSIVLKKT